MSAAPSAPVLTSDQSFRLQTAGQMLRQGRQADAIALLRALLTDVPRLAPAQRLLGMALEQADDPFGAEAAYRAALKADPTLLVAAVELAELLRNLDRGPEAVALLERRVTPRTGDLNLLTYFAFALQSLGRLDDALGWLQQAARTSPSSAVAEHNLAGALGDLHRHGESEAAARRAFAKGLDAPETWLVLARALQGQAREQEAMAAYAEALGRRPDFADVFGDLARLAWLQTGDKQVALRVVDDAISQSPQDIALRVHKAKVLEYAGDLAGAANTLHQALTMVEDPMVRVAAAQVGAHLDPTIALFHAERAFAVRPDNYSVIATLCQTRLAIGQADAAAPLAALLCERQPWDQYAIALQATAWRILGDPRYGELNDYAQLVRGYELQTPDGWSSLGAYLADLAATLEPLHPFLGHPIGQSVRSGSQTQVDLRDVEAPPIRAFLQAIDGPIRSYIAGLGAGADPLRRRASARHGFDGVWSVRLRPNGFHANHIHHRGWISSACHIALPAAVAREPEGWLKFGEPGIPTQPHLPPEHWERPREGRLVLFPSYMWHGTQPFGGDEPRLSIAFDVIPA
jgi:tetratricopeptide (TPR) repeat protein